MYTLNKFKIYNVFRKVLEEGGIDFDPWDGAKEWKWLKQTYYTELHPHVEPVLKEYIQQINFGKHYFNQISK